MLGSKRTIPLWRQRQRRLLALERALTPFRIHRETRSEQVAIARKVKDRKKDEAKSKAWLFRG
jgi:hypothetical protein